MTMDAEQLPADFSIADDFPPASYDQWRELAAEALDGATFEKRLVTHTYEGIDIQPIYTRNDQLGPHDPYGFPGLPPFVRGRRPLGASQVGWDLRQVYAHPDLSAARHSIQQDLQGGVTSLLLQLDQAVFAGWDASSPHAEQLAGAEGLMVYHREDLETLLADVPLSKVGVAVDAGAAFLPAASMLVAHWQHRSIGADQARGAFNADPLGEFARTGRLPITPTEALKQMAALANWTTTHYPLVRAICANTAVYHHAGATAAQDIALGIATAVEYLRAMIDAGMSIDNAAGQILFRINLGTHHFLSIAKLRAARRLWARVIAASGGSATAGAMQMHARTSDRVLTQRDPYVNLLRNTVAMFSAGIGGADVITSVPFDQLTGLPDDFSRRVARNTALILQEEAHLHRVIDPAGGSWFLDQLTEQVAIEGWKIFQQIEREGGMLAALENGWVAEQIDAAYAPRAKDIARRKEGITGVSEFPNLREERVAHPPPALPALQKTAAERQRNLQIARDNPVLAKVASSADQIAATVAAAAAGATIGQMAGALGFHAREVKSIAPLEARSFAEPFEQLRDASDAWLAEKGSRPMVFLANMGPVAHFTARAGYAKNFFEAGGFEVVGDQGFDDASAVAAAFQASGATVAVICSSDKLYPEYVPQVASRLKSAGANSVVLAGYPGDNESAWRSAGVDRFIYMKCDVLTTLRELLREEGVLNA